MSSLEELLEDREIAKHINTNQYAAKEIRAAAAALADKPYAKKALLKIIPALVKREIPVFFSYNKKDEEAAKAIVSILRKCSAGKLKITYQCEFGEDIVGRKWRDKIHDEISKANWFILLFPDQRDDRDWCLYETGFFDAHLTSADRVICLHHPNTEIPNPIEGYHSVVATHEEVAKFLHMVFIKDNPVYGMGPLNSSIKDEIPRLSREIVNAMRMPVTIVREIYEPWIELIIDNPGRLENEDQLDDAIVKTANQKALNLFRLLRKKSTWGQIWRSLPPEEAENKRWREDLFKTIRKIGNDRQFFPVQAVFKNFEGKMYRPVVCAVDREGKEGPIKIFHITFAEDVAVVDRSAMPKSMSLLANTLRSTFRFRWEIIEKFSKRPISEDDVECLENALMRIRKDWESRNLGGAREILELFPDEEQHNRLLRMGETWHKIKNDQKTGELDIAIDEKDTEKIPVLLKKFSPIIQEFLEIAADRFSKLVSANP